MSDGPGRRRLLRDINNALPAALGTSRLRRMDADHLYEVALWAQCWRAAKDAGLTTDLRDRNDNRATQVHLRKAPSEQMSPTQAYTHLHVDIGDGVEVHQGIYLTGNSGAYHQIDVALVQGAEASRVRAGTQQRPRARWMLYGLEAKAYGRTLPIDVGRGVLGLRQDFAQKVAVVTSARPSNAGKLLGRYARGVDARFFACRPGTRSYDELRAILARRLRGY
jgi:hypothetical protein